MKRTLLVSLVCLVACVEDPKPPGNTPVPDDLICPSWKLELAGKTYEGDWADVQISAAPKSLGLRKTMGLDGEGYPAFVEQPYITVFELEDQGDAGVLVSMGITVNNIQYLSDFEGVTAHWTQVGRASGRIEGEVRRVDGDQERQGFTLTYLDVPTDPGWEERYVDCWR